MSVTLNAPNNVVVVGEGLAGLSSAIVAANKGFNVILIQKRSRPTRTPRIFLSETTLNYFKHLGVSRNLNIKPFYMSAQKRGLAQIKRLEKGLAKKVNALGVKILRGEFQQIESKCAIVKTSKGAVVKVPYGLLIGADGAHSAVKKTLNIKSKQIGINSLGSVVFIPSNSRKRQPTLQEVEKENYFLKNANTPIGRFITYQNKKNNRSAPADKQKVISALVECNWNLEIDEMKRKPTQTIENVVVSLKQATTFSDEQQNAILIGDAAATGSFFIGRGANMAFASVAITEQFLQMRKDRDPNAFSQFNAKMQALTDTLVESNRYLFA